MTRIRITTFLLGVAALLLLTATASASDSSLLYSVTTKDLRVAGSGHAMRVSVPANAALSWFTERPARQAGASTASALVSGWQANGFAADPPNAAIVTSDRTGSMQTIVTLRDPRQSAGRVSFRYTVIGKGKMLGMRTTGHPRAGRYDGELFVDSATIPPCSVGSIYVKSAYYQCVTSGVNDYRFYNDYQDGWQTTYACGTNLRVRHYAPGDVTYTLKGCPTYTTVGSSQRLTFNFGNTPAITYSQNSFVGVPAGVTFVMSSYPPCALTTDPASGLYTCILPAGSSTYITRATDGNTRINACGFSGASTLTYDSTAAEVRNYGVSIGGCDNYTAVADVPTTSATVVIHATDDTKLLLNAG